jgi:DNA mismatch endonuclease (patch repair protein)
MRYWVDRPPLPGLRRRADIVFGPARVAVFVDGCFWHHCPEHGTRPMANSGWWQSKLEFNRERDAETDKRLTSAGWEVVRAWEHEKPEEVATRVQEVVLARRSKAARRRRQCAN